MIFLILPGKMLFRFLENLILFRRQKMKDRLPFCQKSKDDLLPKNILKDHISDIIEKDDIQPIKYGILLIEKLKMKKFTQSNTHRENQYD